MSQKIPLRFFNDREIRAVWDEAGNQWWFAVVDIVAAVSESSSPQNYWYVLKNRLKKAKNEPLTKCKGFKLVAADGKRRLTDCLLQKDVLALLEAIPTYMVGFDAEEESENKRGTDQIIHKTKSMKFCREITSKWAFG